MDTSCLPQFQGCFRPGDISGHHGRCTESALSSCCQFTRLRIPWPWAALLSAHAQSLACMKSGKYKLAKFRVVNLEDRVVPIVRCLAESGKTSLWNFFAKRYGGVPLPLVQLPSNTVSSMLKPMMVGTQKISRDFETNSPFQKGSFPKARPKIWNPFFRIVSHGFQVLEETLSCISVSTGLGPWNVDRYQGKFRCMPTCDCLYRKWWVRLRAVLNERA